MAWQPGARAAALAMEVPYEDVPDHLWGPLYGWVNGHISGSRSALRSVAIMLRLHVVDVNHDSWDALYKVRLACEADRTVILDIIEHLLPSVLKSYGVAPVNSLDASLREGNSIYRVRDDRRGLEQRIDVAVRDQVRAVVAAAKGSPGNHLTTAWNCAYGRTSDPVKAYSEAIKAVEAAAAPVVSPTNAKATLGTMIRDVKAKPSKWTFAISAQGDDGVLTVLRMMEALWNGQTSRHGGNAPTQPETAESARAAVHLAATLVQFFIGGAVAVK